MKNLHANEFRGFSLVELLIVIAIIAIIAAIAIPNLQNISHQSVYAKDRRNAQTVAAVAGAAKAAGVTTDLSGTNAIALLEPPGVRTASGISFSISPMSVEERTGALQYLESAPDATMGVRYKAQ